ncbi:putative quinol monooxygenase [Sphingomonas sp. AOB5]|uniref:putative quinol monooxygenase n=1 Tax=Sphingomonas sp. AOB5 TaxID=3034017 RepID=UPI0023F8F967|nr:putative quinol monooxygenase [Sphingomonas sp. AOB5]MDF7773859.1 putative quinol monooxygenase [Sphingomonas sp. AOB5]
MTGRRPVLAGLALAILGGPVLAREFSGEFGGVEEIELYGLIGKMTAHPGKRNELINLLTAGTADMPGCLAYIVAEDVKDENGIWITEVWQTKGYHADSLKLPAVQAAIAKGRPLIAGFDTHVETRPVGGMGIAG